MARLPIIDPEESTGKAHELLTAVQKKLGLVPNMTRVMVNSCGVGSLHRIQWRPGWWQSECQDPGTHCAGNC